MKRRWKKYATLLLVMTSVSGCWDMKEIQSIVYATTIGFDYVDGHIIVYAQLIDLFQVAKTESQSIREPATWVGTEKGEHIEQAMRKLHQTVKEHLFWDHVESLVFHERLLRAPQPMQTILDYLKRMRDIRMNSMLYATSESFEKLFVTNALFDYTPLSSILIQPIDTYKDASMLPPLSVRVFDLQNHAPYATTLLPSLAIRDNVWRKQEEKRPLLTISGAYVVRAFATLGWLSLDDLIGLRWMSPQTKQTSVDLKQNHVAIGSLTVLYPHAHIVPRTLQNPSVKEHYTAHITVKGSINVLPSHVPLSARTLETRATDTIKAEIIKTYRAGLKYGADVYNLRTHAYRQQPHLLHASILRGERPLPADALDVTLDVKITYAGKLRFTE